MVNFVDHSDKAFEQFRGHFQKKYNLPFENVPVGKSFIVPKAEIPESSIVRALASRQAKKWGKNFRVVDHGDKWEIACLSLRPEGPAIAKPPGRPRTTPKPTVAPGQGKFTDKPGRLLIEPDLEEGHGTSVCPSCGQHHDFNAFLVPYDENTRMFTLSCTNEECRTEYKVSDRLQP